MSPAASPIAPLVRPGPKDCGPWKVPVPLLLKTVSAGPEVFATATSMNVFPSTSTATNENGPEEPGPVSVGPGLELIHGAAESPRKICTRLS